MKIVVNSGTIGTPTAVLLAEQGHDVTLIVRAVKANPEWERLGLRQAPFDMNDAVSMERVLQGADAFFSLTPLVQNLVEAGRKAVDAAKRAGISRIVRSSAQGAGPAAAIQLGRWHGAVEAAVEAAGIPFTILRPANFMQNYITFNTIKGQDAIYAPLGTAKVSPVDTRDVSAVAAAALVEPGHEGKVYELTGGESLSSEEVAGIFSELLGRPVGYVDVPESAARASMADAGVPPWLVELLSELNAITKAGYLAAVSPDVERVLKRKPISFAQFVKDHIEKFRP
jgi:uncharacterized protein YbjT (DUF2867 family)